MSSSLGQVLVNILVSILKKSWLPRPEKPEVYFCYVDNRFCLYNSEMEVDLFLYFPQPAHKFIQDKKTISSLLFLDFVVCTNTSCFLK